MTKALAVLIVEDSEIDAELIVRLLKKADYELTFERVETDVQMRAALEKQAWDVVISDYNLPKFNGNDALVLLQEMELDIPFIVVSGMMGEEAAVAIMKAGAHDYLIKDDLTRLPPAIERELTQAKVRRERRQAEEAVRLNEKRFRALIENSAEAITLLDAAGAVVYDSPAAPGMLGYDPKEWIGKNVFELLHSDDLRKIQDVFQSLVKTPHARINSTFRLRHKSGSWLWIEAVATNLLAEPSVEAIVVNYRDITERKQTEERVQRHIQHLASLHEIDLAIASSFDLRTSLNILLEKVTLQLEVDAASVLLLDPYTNTLEYSAQRGFRRMIATQSASILLGESLAGRAALERKTIQAHGSAFMQESPRFEALWREEGFESYFVVPLLAKGQVKGVLEIFHRAAIAATPDWMDFLSTLGGQAAIAIDNAQLFESLQRANLELSLAYDATIEGWSYALDLRDKETEGHTLRVAGMTLRLAEAMGMSKSEIVQIRRGGLLHDIGKMGVPDHILLKPGPLTQDEWELMRQHPVFAYNMLSRIAYLHPAIDIPYCHHEKWDGSGYPRRLRGEEIPLAARLFAVVDVWDALRSDRPYRPGWTEDKVLEHIQEESGKHFDPQVVAGFLAMLQKDASTGRDD